MDAGALKSEAITFLCDQMNIQLKDTISFGDNFNDIEMLNLTGKGFAMLHAHYSESPVDALRLKTMMRHRSLSSTMVYYNPTQEEEFKIKTDFIEELYKLVPSLKEGEKVFE